MTEFQQEPSGAQRDGSRPYAVVTGASSGIGLELARQLGERGYDVLLAAEGADVTAAAAAVATPSAEVDPLQVDLSTSGGVEQLWSRIQAAGRPVDVLALNAGVGVAGPFVETDLDADLALIALNITGAVHLAKRVLPGMVDRGAGRVLVTSSVAATMPGPYYATYAASKAFLLSFAEAIRYEVADAGVTVTALMPGPTDTEFFDRAGMQDTRAGTSSKDDPALVARQGLDALFADDDRVVAGSVTNKAQVAGTRLMSEPMKAAAHAKLTEPGSGKD